MVKPGVVVPVDGEVVDEPDIADMGSILAGESFLISMDLLGEEVTVAADEEDEAKVVDDGATDADSAGVTLRPPPPPEPDTPPPEGAAVVGVTVTWEPTLKPVPTAVAASTWKYIRKITLVKRL